MNTNLAGDDELDPGQADSPGRQLPPVQRAVGHGDIDHQVGAGGNHFVHPNLLYLKGQLTFVHLALGALGTVQRDLRSFGQTLRGVPGTDDGGHLQLPADNGGMTGGTAAVGNDPRRAAHDRYPVRVGPVGDQNGAFRELLALVVSVQLAHRAGGDGAADTGAFHQHRALLLQFITGEDRAVFL